mmetsp:Transcript_50352/g.90431  ORF Transcript_50352/g.90431 Transcript_50352/m.90431 type:complete len:85 (+) Transcript_50352:190-444(+)
MIVHQLYRSEHHGTVTWGCFRIYMIPVCKSVDGAGDADGEVTPSCNVALISGWSDGCPCSLPPEIVSIPSVRMKSMPPSIPPVK